MNSREMVCICCPLGCMLKVADAGGGQIAVEGNSCPRGADYGRKEMSNPVRIVTSTVRVKGSRNIVLPVKTASPVPKERIKDCITVLSEVEIDIPVHIGDVVLENVAGTGVDMIATKNLDTLI